MKVFILLLLLGIASASFQKELDEAVDDLVFSFLEGLMDQSSSLMGHADFDGQFARQIDDDTKAELGRKLKETLNKILEKVKTAVEEGKVVEKEFLMKIRELRKHLKSLREEIGDEAKDLLEKIREKAKEYLKNLLEKLNKSKRAVDYQVQEATAAINSRDILLQLREHLKKTDDPEILKSQIEKLFDERSELLQQLLETLREKGRDEMKILIDALLDDDDDYDIDIRMVAHGIKDYWEKVKDYFKDLKIDLQEKYMKFGEWVKNNFNKGWEHSKDKMDNIKAIAKEFLKHAKGISKEVANEAGEFFQNYKEELGNLWEELKERINEIKKKKD